LLFVVLFVHLMYRAGDTRLDGVLHVAPKVEVVISPGKVL